ncbi:ATP-dependent DNA ligase [Sphingomonas sp. NIBR02145]|uniref:ATP-dependent DNA ligase n=1 Tax=Sphingomonas sp. NIBR02145 TaxID=3014784 RepID=UPI0022B4BDF9|nr:ATP-dependent DNA ligase [Sphingomonas sp. NIBR02145]WHU04385.1 ATP-dependent DNA ligase [Sphingomonas sp. NIBR02145]
MTDKSHPLADTVPMEAKLVEALPAQGAWQFEPKWDGFRAIASRLGGHVELRSKSGKSLARYFPEIVASLLATRSDDYVLDGELILPMDGILSFDALQARLHPAESRILRLSHETPAQLMLFDCLALGGTGLADRPLAERRAALERFHARDGSAMLLLSPHASDLAGAQAWLAASGEALDGVIAKPLDQPYRPGERAMLKVKQHRTADCVVGGFRRAKDSQSVVSLLLGLYDKAGLLNHVGFTSALAKQDRAALTERLDALIAPPGFTGKAPGGPSRWNDGKESEWLPLKPELVVEVSFDQVTGDRFRHGTGLVRWRPDKAPRQCRMEQLDYALRPSELADVSGPRG